MVEDENTSNGTENQVVEAPVEIAEPKKKRAPRRSPAEMAAAATAKSQKATGKTSAKAKAVTPAMDLPIAAYKKPVAKTTGARPSQAPTTLSTAADEMADLVKLEEENRTLRGQLSEKLRAENADLRRRLGQA